MWKWHRDISNIFMNFVAVITLVIHVAGKDNADALIFIRDGGRMPKPTECPIECPQALYDVMLHCWKKVPEERPTFEYLYHLFDDFDFSTEQQ